MNNRSRGGAALAVVALVVSVRCILAREYAVGDVYCATGTIWDRYCNFQAWSTDKDFFVGDTLVFRFSSVSSTVAEVTKDDFDGCAKSLLPAKPIRVYGLSPVTVNLSTAGPFYIANTIEACDRQRFAIIVNAPATPSPDVVPSTTTTPTTPSTTATKTPSSSSAAMTTSSPPPPEKSSSGGSSAAGEVAGVVLGVAAFMAKIWLVTYCVQRRKKKQRLNNGQVHNSMASEAGEDPIFGGGHDHDHDHEMGELDHKKVRM